MFQNNATDNRPLHICQCGCGEPIPWRPTHRYRIPRYILAHYLRLGTSKRLDKLREAKAAKRVQPPDGWISPAGVCECGCGEATRIANVNRPERSEYRGYPRRFRHGHYGRWLLSQHGANHPNWRGGRIAVKGGYIKIYLPDYPNANLDGYVLEHRYVYETTRGVQLPPHVAIHHINGVKHDNRPENLMAATNQEHRHVHVRSATLLSLAYDAQLLQAFLDHVRANGTLPDLERLASTIHYGGAYPTAAAPVTAPGASVHALNRSRSISSARSSHECP